VTGSVGTTVTNIASGGAGTGTITYSSGTTTVATVNATTWRGNTGRHRQRDDHSNQSCELGLHLGDCDVSTAGDAGNAGDRVYAERIGQRSSRFDDQQRRQWRCRHRRNHLRQQQHHSSDGECDDRRCDRSGSRLRDSHRYQGCGCELQPGAGVLHLQFAELELRARLGRRAVLAGVPADNGE
jgi:hypothetical protein